MSLSADLDLLIFPFGVTGLKEPDRCCVRFFKRPDVTLLSEKLVVKKLGHQSPRQVRLAYSLKEAA